MSELSGYRVYAGLSPADFRRIAELDDAYVTTCSVKGLSLGTYYFYVTAVDTEGRESPPSEIGDKSI
jgi:hypothetical protein